MPTVVEIPSLSEHAISKKIMAQRTKQSRISRLLSRYSVTKMKIMFNYAMNQLTQISADVSFRS